MTNATTDIIDQTVITALLADFDQDTTRLLVAAAEADIIRLGEQLVQACEAQDAEAQHRARHSLTGVCSNFGATALLAIAAADLSHEAAQEDFRNHAKITISALRAIAEAS